MGRYDRLRLVRTARELLAPSPQHPSPTGLGPTVAEATAGMSPGRVQEIVAAAGLPSTHDAVSAVAVADRPVHRPEADGRAARQRLPGLRGRTATPRLGPAVRAGHRRTGRTPALAAGPGPAAAHRARNRRTAARGGPASARRPGAPRDRAAAAGGRARRHPSSTGCGQRGGRAGVHRARDRRGAAEGLGRGRPGRAAGRRAERPRPQADGRRPGRVRAGRRLLGRTRLRGRPVGVGRRGRRAVRGDPRVRRVAGVALGSALGAARGGMADGDPDARA